MGQQGSITEIGRASALFSVVWEQVVQLQAFPLVLPLFIAFAPIYKKSEICIDLLKAV